MFDLAAQRSPILCLGCVARNFVGRPLSARHLLGRYPRNSQEPSTKTLWYGSSSCDRTYGGRPKVLELLPFSLVFSRWVRLCSWLSSCAKTSSYSGANLTVPQISEGSLWMLGSGAPVANKNSRSGQFVELPEARVRSSIVYGVPYGTPRTVVPLYLSRARFP